MSSSNSNGFLFLQLDHLFLQIGIKHPSFLTNSDTHVFLQNVVEMNNKMTIVKCIKIYHDQQVLEGK